MRFWLAFVIAIMGMNSAVAAPLKVISSIKPVALIVEGITAGTANHSVLLPIGASPHDYGLKPSDVRHLQQADVVFWVGTELESFLSDVLENNPNAVSLMKAPNVSWRQFETEDHDHHGHDHGTRDPHFWLGAQQSQQVAIYITQALEKIDPTNAGIYRKNLASFTERLAKTQQNAQQVLSPLKDKGYFVFHDGYGYFEEAFQLNHLGHFTVSPERRAGAKTLLAIRKQLIQEKAQCVFIEPQFSPKVVASMVQGTKVEVGTLDPMGAEIPLAPDGYAQFLMQMAKQFQTCLQ